MKGTCLYAVSYTHLEQEVFSTMLAAGFTDDFSSQRSPLSSEQIYPFFHQQIPTFEALGEVTLSDSLLDLYQVERPKIDVKMCIRDRAHPHHE